MRALLIGVWTSVLFGAGVLWAKLDNATVRQERIEWYAQTLYAQQQTNMTKLLDAAYLDGAISGGKAVVWLQSKGYTATNITWRQVRTVAGQMRGQNQAVHETLAREDAEIAKQKAEQP